MLIGCAGLGLPLGQRGMIAQAPTQQTPPDKVSILCLRCSETAENIHQSQVAWCPLKVPMSHPPGSRRPSALSDA